MSNKSERDKLAAVLKISGQCTQPDREVSGLICGYPLPCPYHTVIIDTTNEPPTVTVPITSRPAHDPKLLEMLKDIGRAIVKDRESG